MASRQAKHQALRQANGWCVRGGCAERATIGGRCVVHYKMALEYNKAWRVRKKKWQQDFAKYTEVNNG